MKKQNKKWIIGIVAALIALLALAMISAKDRAPASGKPVVKIGAMFPLSGDGAVYGEYAKRAVELFQADFAKQNPDAKYEYKVIFENVGFNAAKDAATVIKKLRSVDKIDAVMHYTSSKALIIKPLAAKEKFIQLSYIADPAGVDGQYSFRVTSGFKKGAEMSYKRLKKEGAKTASIVLSNHPAMIAVVADSRPVFESKPDFKILDEFVINPGERDFGPIIQRIKASKPDVIIQQLFVPESDIFVRALRRAGVNIPITGFQTFGLMTDKTLVEGLWEVDVATADPAFNTRLTGDSAKTDVYYGEYVYSMMMLLTNAWENTSGNDGGKPTSEEVAARFLELSSDIETPMGKLELDRDTGDLLTPITYKQIRGGMPVMVKE